MTHTVAAAFGGEINDPLLGYIIPVSVFTQQCPGNTTSFLPENSGCPDLCVTTPNQPTEPWIALVQRGKCEFVKKVREAQRLGAKAVVVGGEDPEISGYPDTLVNMYSPGSLCFIFAISSLQLYFRRFIRCYNTVNIHQVLGLSSAPRTYCRFQHYPLWVFYTLVTDHRRILCMGVVFVSL